MDDQAHQYNMFIENTVESVNVNLKQEKIVIETDLNIYYFFILLEPLFFIGTNDHNFTSSFSHLFTLMNNFFLFSILQNFSYFM